VCDSIIHMCDMTHSYVRHDSAEMWLEKMAIAEATEAQR